MNIKLGKFFNIPLYLNIYTAPFAAFICMSSEFGLLSLAVFILTLFFVVLHEYGHCLLARKFGWTVADVTILPFGGIARINFKFDKPWEEIYVALAGPAVNVILSIPFFFLCLATIYFEQYPFMLVFLICLCINIMLATFNMFPIFPMDGGRVLRSFLSFYLGHEKATWWAVRIGQVGGLCLAIIAFYFYQYFAALIFIIMIIFSQNELAYAHLVGAINNIRNKIATILNRPELKQASLAELLIVVEAIQDEELKEKLQVDEVTNLLKDLSRYNIAI